MKLTSLIFVHEEVATSVFPLNEIKAIGLFVWQWAHLTMFILWCLFALMAVLAAVASYWRDLFQAPSCTLFITRQEIAKEEAEAQAIADAKAREEEDAKAAIAAKAEAAAAAKAKAAADAAKSEEQRALELKEKHRLEFDEWHSDLLQQIKKSFSDWCNDKEAAAAKATKTQEQLDLEAIEEREAIQAVLCGVSATPHARYTLKRFVRDPTRLSLLIQAWLCGTSAWLCVASTSDNPYSIATLATLVFFAASFPASAAIREPLVRLVIGLSELLFFFVFEATCNAIWAGLSQLNSNLTELMIWVRAPCSCACKLVFYITCFALGAPHIPAGFGFLNANSSAGPWEAFDSFLFPAFCPLHDGFSTSTALELLVRVWYIVHWIPTLYQTLLVTWYRGDQSNAYAAEKTMEDLQRRTSLINRQISAVPTAETIANSTPLGALFLASVQIVYHLTGVWSLGPCILTFAVCGGWWVAATVCLAFCESIPDMIFVTILKWGFMYLHMSFLTAMTKLVRTVRTQLVRTVRTVGGPHLTYAQQCDAYHQAGVDFPIAADAAKLSALVFTVGFFLVLTVMYAFASIPEDSAKEASSITDKAMLKKTIKAENGRISNRIRSGKPCSTSERLLHALFQFGEQLYGPQHAPLPSAQ